MDAPLDAPPPDYRLLRFHTDMVAKREDRLEAWRDMISRKLMAVEIDTLSDATIEVSATLRKLPGLHCGVGFASETINRRTRSLIAHDNDDLALIVNIEGRLIASHRTREIELGAGDAYLMACSEIGTYARPQPGTMMCARFPRSALEGRVKDIDDGIGRLIGRKREGLQLLMGYFRGLNERSALVTPELRELVVHHVYDLVATLMRPVDLTFDVPENNGGVQAARLAAIRGYIKEHAADPTLTLERVGTRHRLSPRQVQRLFEADGDSFSQFLQLTRLAKAYATLIDTRADGRLISEVAYDCGFGDVSTFNRVFRRRYGAAPSEVRNEDVLLRLDPQKL
jgi:AraC-like DNA-binding protein